MRVFSGKELFPLTGAALAVLLALSPHSFAQNSAPSSLSGGGGSGGGGGNAPASGVGDGSGDGSDSSGGDGHDQLDTGSGGGPSKVDTYPVPGGGGTVSLALNNIFHNEAMIVAYINFHGCEIDSSGKKKTLTISEFENVARRTANATEIFLTHAMTVSHIAGGPVAGGLALTKEQRATVNNVQNNYTLPGSPSHNLILLNNMTCCGQSQNDGEALASRTLPHELLHIILKQFGTTDLSGGADIGKNPSDPTPIYKQHQIIQTVGFGAARADESNGLGDWTPPGGKPDCGDGTSGKTASADGASGDSGDDSGSAVAASTGSNGDGSGSAAAAATPPPQPQQPAAIPAATVVGPAPASTDTSAPASPPPPDFTSFPSN